MNRKFKRKITICGGAMAIALLTGIVLQQPTDISQLHTPTKAVTEYVGGILHPEPDRLYTCVAEI